MNKTGFLGMAILAIIIGTSIAFLMASSQPPEVGYYKPHKGVFLSDKMHTGTYKSILGALPVQNPISFDIGFQDQVPWLNNTKSPGVEIVVLENELIRSNYEGTVQFVRSDRAWRKTHIDIDNGIIDGNHYTTVYEYVGDIRVVPGQEVAMGEIIGQGFRGRGVVYFEIQVNGFPVNPITPS
jgi:hypothetical protein